jgi:hypothetical protein
VGVDVAGSGVAVGDGVTGVKVGKGVATATVASTGRGSLELQLVRLKKRTKIVQNVIGSLRLKSIIFFIPSFYHQLPGSSKVVLPE